MSEKNANLSAPVRAEAAKTEPCRTCGGGGFIATKRFIDDGWGEVDVCPDCDPYSPSPVREAEPLKALLQDMREDVADCCSESRPCDACSGLVTYIRRLSAALEGAATKGQP